MDNIYIASPTVALVTSVVIQMFKNSPLISFMDRDTQKLNAFISGIVAFITSLGLVVSFDMSPDGAFAAGLHGNIWDVLHVLGHFPVQWATQHMFYKGLIVPAETLGEIRAVLKEGLLNQLPQKKTEVPPTGDKP
jgi:hypothetical protein